MSNAVLQECRLAIAQESRFLAANRSNMDSSVLLDGRSADVQEFCFQTAKRSDIGCADLQGSLFSHC